MMFRKMMKYENFTREGVKAIPLEGNWSSTWAVLLWWGICMHFLSLISMFYSSQSFISMMNMLLLLLPSCCQVVWGAGISLAALRTARWVECRPTVCSLLTWECCQEEQDVSMTQVVSRALLTRQHFSWLAYAWNQGSLGIYCRDWMKPWLKV